MKLFISLGEHHSLAVVALRSATILKAGFVFLKVLRMGRNFSEQKEMASLGDGRGHSWSREEDIKHHQRRRTLGVAQDARSEGVWGYAGAQRLRSQTRHLVEGLWV